MKPVKDRCVPRMFESFGLVDKVDVEQRRRSIVQTDEAPVAGGKAEIDASQQPDRLIALPPNDDEDVDVREGG